MPVAYCRYCGFQIDATPGAYPGLCPYCRQVAPWTMREPAHVPGRHVACHVLTPWDRRLLRELRIGYD